ncbi:DUF5816 domain-containing protein [Halorubrum sp. BV1]|uniref:DUF5816 domain-containing protein n=1 Tax=Halorubrum sp. BV1 TaxID=1498500 RepID=UPI00067973DE|nr:DUF5816 domain-containing protein [Halorubrum sp. BV1]
MSLDASTTTDGERVYTDRTLAERGADGPFYVVFEDADGSSRWGFRCGNCDSFGTAMDTMGRIQCTDCGNIKKPDEWDAAHE